MSYFYLDIITFYLLSIYRIHFNLIEPNSIFINNLILIKVFIGLIMSQVVRQLGVFIGVISLEEDSEALK